MAINAETARVVFVETAEEINDGGFPRARGAGEGDRFAGRGLAEDQRRGQRVDRSSS